MKRFEAYLIRLKLGFRKLGKTEQELIASIYEAYKLFENESDLTDEEMSALADEIKGCEYEKTT